MKTTLKIVHWLPRIVCIAAILFVSLFALDAFEPGKSFGQQIISFLIHLIPSFILLAMLLIAWKWEWLGGILFTLVGAVMSPFIFFHNYQLNHSIGMSLGIILMITFPFLLAGVLFLVSYYMKQRAKRSSS